MYGFLLFAVLFLVVGAFSRRAGASADAAAAESRDLIVAPSKALMEVPQAPSAPAAPEVPVPQLEEGEIVPEPVPAPEAEDSNNPKNWFRNSYGETEWQEFEFSISIIEYELDEYEKEPVPSDLSPEDLADRQRYIEKLKVELEVLRDMYADRMATEPPDYNDYEEEREQFDFGESAADW